jgi:predicted RNase H-like HicB family nuclease
VARRLLDTAPMSFNQPEVTIHSMRLTVHFDREADGRWIASVPELPGVHVYGATREAALSKAVALSYSVLADEVEHGERDARSVLNITFETPEAA